MDKDYSSLRLDHQLCFPLYACSKEIVRKYAPILKKYDLTYTQYIAMMVLWEEHELSVKKLGERLFLDSGTLTPLLKKLEAKGYVTRQRCVDDERCLTVALTDKGAAMQDDALEIPKEMDGCIKLTQEEAMTLYRLLYKMLDAN